MYRFKSSLIALIGVLTLVGIVTVTVPHIGRGASGNGTSAPTTQTQNVNVVNTPAVNAQQTGTWNVGISGTPSVAVSNFPATTNVAIDTSANVVKIGNSDPLLVRDADNPAYQRFRTSVFVSLPDGTTFAAVNPGITPPTGKLLVIEAISASGNIPSGQKYACSLDVTDQFAQLQFELGLPLTLQGTFGPVDTFQGNTTTRIYLDNSDTVAFDVFRTAGAGAAGVRVSFSGYMIDAQ
jgi:hypothetical protein